MPTPAAPETLAYTTALEREFARARAVAALVTGPAGVLLLVVSSGSLLLGGLGVLCILAGVGWLMAARAGSKRARERASWCLLLTDEGLSVSTAHGERHVLRERIGGVTLDDDTLQVVVSVPNEDELRLDATWGALGAVDLHARLLAWWQPGGSPSAHDN